MARVVVAILASVMVIGAVSWWWSRAADEAWPSRAKDLAARKSPGMTMEKFSLLEMQRHQRRWEILAEAAQVDDKRGVTTIEGVRFTLFSATHGPIQVTAKRGVIENHSKNMQVCGDVRLLIGTAFSLVTDCLQWHAATQELAANTPVVVQMGNLQAEGHGFLGSLAAERFELHDQVRARWVGP